MSRAPRKHRSQDEPAEPLGAPGSVPTPEHRPGVPGAPSTNPPEAPIVPSNAALAEFWSSYGPSAVLVLVGLVVAALLLNAAEM